MAANKVPGNNFEKAIISTQTTPSVAPQASSPNCCSQTCSLIRSSVVESRDDTNLIKPRSECIFEFLKNVIDFHGNAQDDPFAQENQAIKRKKVDFNMQNLEISNSNAISINVKYIFV